MRYVDLLDANSLGQRPMTDFYENRDEFTVHVTPRNKQLRRS
jgi:hypothetical protein